LIEISDSNLILIVILVALLIVAVYEHGKSKARVRSVPREGYRTPHLEELIVRAKYAVKATNVEQVYSRLYAALNPEPRIETYWYGDRQGNTIIFERELGEPRTKPSKELDYTEKFFQKLIETRSGVPMDVVMVGSDVGNGSIEFDVTIRPVMYRRIGQLHLLEYTDQQIQEAQHECTEFANQLKGMMGAVELEPPAIRLAASITDLRKQLRRLGMPSQADLLVEAETKISIGQAPDGVKNCRSAVEQVLRNLMKRVGLDPTDSFKHDLDRLVKHQHVDPWISESIHQFHYRLLSEDAHDKYRPKPMEAEYILALTEETISFLLKRIG